MALENAETIDPKAARPRIYFMVASVGSLTMLFSAVAYQMIPVSVLPPLDTVTSRLVFTLQWNALTVSVMYFMVYFIGSLRSQSQQQNPLSTADRDKIEVC